MDNHHRYMNIGDSAFELICMINFLINDNAKLNEFYSACEGLNEREVNRYVYRLRERELAIRNYGKSQFVLDYNIDPMRALETLFNEPLDKYRLAKLKINDPEKIYDIHREQNNGIRFLAFVRLI